MDRGEENGTISRVLAGQRNEFAHLVSRYQGPLFRIVGNMVPPAMVEDVVQEVFLAAFRHLRRFDPQRGAFRTWLYRIARNAALNAQKKKRELPLPEEMAPIDPDTPADALLRREAADRLDRALSKLPFRERMVFVLADLEGLSYGEIARIEKLPLGTVKSRLARARLKLKSALQGYRD